MMYKYQRHLTRHQKYINAVYVMRWFKSLKVVDEDTVIDWMDEHAGELHGMFVELS